MHGAFHQARESTAGLQTRIDEPAAPVDDGPPCRGQQFRRAWDCIARHGHESQARACCPPRVTVRRFLHRCKLHVAGNIQQHWPWSAGACHLHRAPHRRGDLVGLAHLAVPLGDRTRHAERIAFLKSVRANRACGDLPADAQDRHRIAERIQQTGDGIGYTGAGSNQDHTHPTGCPGIALGSMNCRLFMADQHMAQARFAVQSVVKRQRSAARIPEEVSTPQSTNAQSKDSALLRGVAATARTALAAACFPVTSRSIFIPQFFQNMRGNGFNISYHYKNH